MEQSLFTTACKIHGRNSCRIARVISTRSCAEVRACVRGFACLCSPVDAQACCPLQTFQVAERLRMGDLGREHAAGEHGDAGMSMTGRGGRWKRRARGGKAGTTSRKKVTATVRRRMAHSEDQVRVFTGCCTMPP